MPVGSPIFLPRARAPHVLQDQPEGAADHRIGTRALPQHIASGMDAQTLGDGPIDDDEGRAGMVVVWIACRLNAGIGHRFDRGENHREMLGQRPRHHRVRGDSLHARPAERGTRNGRDVVGPATGAGEHARDTLARGRNGGKPVTPSLLHEPRLELLDVAGRLHRRSGAAGGGPARVRILSEGTQHSLDDGLGLGRHHRRRYAADRVGHRHHGQTRKAPGADLGLGERNELIRPQDHTGHAPRFQLRGVVDTPRRARASVG
jgi:hypothetical protein